VAELHFFPMYAAEWLAGEATTLMTPEQESAFLRLLLHSWLSTGVPCSIPEDDRALAELSRLGKRWLKVGEFVRDQFEPVDGYPGRLRNAKLWKVYVAQMEKHSKRVIAGALGGTAKAKGKQRSSIAKALLKQKASTPANPMLYQSESESELESEAESKTTKRPSKSGDLGVVGGWPAEAASFWGAKVAPVKVGRISGPLKPIVDTHGWAKVRAGMEAYIVGTRPVQRNVQAFANTANYWIGLGFGARRTPSGELSMNDEMGDLTPLGQLVEAQTARAR
jgi:uncharacterized protein YdaU (DUF1376 family)